MSNVIKVNFKKARRIEKYSELGHTFRTIISTTMLLFLGMLYLGGCFFLILSVLK